MLRPELLDAAEEVGRQRARRRLRPDRRAVRVAEDEVPAEVRGDPLAVDELLEGRERLVAGHDLDQE